MESQERRFILSDTRSRGPEILLQEKKIHYQEQHGLPQNFSKYGPCLASHCSTILAFLFGSDSFTGNSTFVKSSGCFNDYREAEPTAAADGMSDCKFRGRDLEPQPATQLSWGLIIKWASSSEFGTYRLCEQRRFRRACASAQSRQNLRCSLIQAMSQEEASDRKPDPCLAGHAQLKYFMMECSKTQIRLTRPKLFLRSFCHFRWFRSY